MSNHYTNTVSTVLLLFFLFISSASSSSFIRQYTDDSNTNFQGMQSLLHLDLIRYFHITLLFECLDSVLFNHLWHILWCASYKYYVFCLKTEENGAVPDAIQGEAHYLRQHEQEISSRDYKLSVSNTVKGLRDRPPSSYSLKMESFNTLLKSTNADKYVSRPFSAADYKWYFW